MSLTMQRGLPQDHPDVMRLLNERIAWLSSIGLDQWSNRDFSEQMKDSLASGLTWCLMDDGQMVGTATVSTYADPDFWNAEQARTPALYMSKMATAIGRGDDNFGAEILGWLRSHAQAYGIGTVRWDAWRTNDGLHRYYKSLGARHLRTISPAHRRSGALFEMSHTAVVSDVTTVDPATGSLEIPEQSRYRMQVTSENTTSDIAEVPVFGHRLSGLIMSDPAVEVEGILGPLTTSCRDGHLATIYDAGPGWRLRKFFDHPIADWPVLTHLRSGQPYRLHHETGADQCRVQVSGYLC